MCAAERLTVAELEAAIAEHARSARFDQCRCGHAPFADCWQRAEMVARLDHLAGAGQDRRD